MIFFEIKDLKKDVVITSNIDECPEAEFFLDNKNNKIVSKRLKSQYKELEGISIWLIVKDDEDILTSNKFFNKILLAYGEISVRLLNFYIDKIATHSHSLTTIHGKMKQKMQGFANAKKFRGNNYEESKKNIAEIIKLDVNRAADTICYLNKRIYDMGASIEGFNIMYLYEDSSIVKTKDINIKKVIQTTMAPFLYDLSIKNINVDLKITDEYAVNNFIPINYEFFDVAMYNFFDNMIKYVRPKTNIEVTFNKIGKKFKIEFKMVSIRIELNEKDRIFDDGYSGINAQSVGYGKGMHIVKKALSLMGLRIIAVPDHSTTINDSIGFYTNNIFVISNSN